MKKFTRRKKMRDFLQNTEYLNNGVRHIYKFDNGYGASVIKHDYSYGGRDGLWEIAVLENDELCYTTPITEDVIGHLSWENVENYLQKIKEL
jgi:hypothetical protein